MRKVGTSLAGLARRASGELVGHDTGVEVRQGGREIDRATPVRFIVERCLLLTIRNELGKQRNLRDRNLGTAQQRNH
jgi:hypothetical protein